MSLSGHHRCDERVDIGPSVGRAFWGRLAGVARKCAPVVDHALGGAGRLPRNDYAADGDEIQVGGGFSNYVLGPV